MTISNRLRRWLSYFTFGPIHKGYGTTTQPSCEMCVEKDIDTVDLNRPAFFKPRCDLGPFEIRQIVTKDDGTVMYVIYNSVNERTFEMSKPWFNFFFEEIIDEELGYKPFENSQQ